MRHVTIPTLIAALLALTACGGSNRSVDPGQIRIEPPSESVMQRCALAVDLPDGPMTQAEVETHWRRDRAALAACRGRHGALAAWARGAVAAIDGR